MIITTLEQWVNLSCWSCHAVLRNCLIIRCYHDDISTSFPYYWHFVQGIQFSRSYSPPQIVSLYSLLNKQQGCRWLKTPCRSSEITVMEKYLWESTNNWCIIPETAFENCSCAYLFIHLRASSCMPCVLWYSRNIVAEMERSCPLGCHQSGLLF